MTVTEDDITPGQIWEVAAHALERRDARLLARCADALRGSDNGFLTRRGKFGRRAVAAQYNVMTLLRGES